LILVSILSRLLAASDSVSRSVQSVDAAYDKKQAEGCQDDGQCADASVYQSYLFEHQQGAPEENEPSNSQLVYCFSS